MQKALIIALSVFILAACTVPETKIYSLYMPAEKMETSKTGELTVLLVVHSPKNLSQPYITSRTSPYQVEIARNSKWDAPPDNIIRDAFRDSFSSTGMFKEIRTSHAISGGSHALRINLKKFERSYTADVPYGEILLEAEFISPDGRKLFSSTVEKRVKLDDKTFLSLAKGLSSALSEGVAEVRAGIIKALGK